MVVSSQKGTGKPQPWQTAFQCLHYYVQYTCMWFVRDQLCYVLTPLTIHVWEGRVKVYSLTIQVTVWEKGVKKQTHTRTHMHTLVHEALTFYELHVLPCSYLHTT